MRLTILLLVALTVGGVAASSAEARQPGRPPRVGVLHPGAPPPAAPSLVIEGLRAGLGEMGYVEGRTVLLEYRWAHGKPEALPGLAAELMGLKVDVLLAVSVPALHAVRDVELSSPLIQQAGNRAAAFALKNRLPAISMFRTFADAGGLMAYGPDLVVFFRRSATYVDRILKGARPADLPIERPTRYEFVINSRTAKTLSLTLPPSLLLRADDVIQ